MSGITYTGPAKVDNDWFMSAKLQDGSKPGIFHRWPYEPKDQEIAWFKALAIKELQTERK